MAPGDGTVSVPVTVQTASQFVTGFWNAGELQLFSLPAEGWTGPDIFVNSARAA